MNKKIKIATPAKINLSLEILDRFPNGFHSISSIMQTISLYDYLTFNVSNCIGENKICLSGNSSNIPYNEKNIVYKILNLYLNKIETKGIKIEVIIEKYIPVEAGLAGGSTNAAGALCAINKLFNDKLSLQELHELASKVGSDLNFCIEGGACEVSARGENIEEKLPFRNYKILLVKPKNISVSTSDCYKKFSAKYFEPKEAFYSQKIANLFKNSTEFSSKKLAKFLYNDLEKPAFEMHPQLKQIKNNLIEAGCTGALMSGSGSSIFGIVDSNIDCELNIDSEIFCLDATSDGVKFL